MSTGWHAEGETKLVQIVAKASLKTAAGKRLAECDEIIMFYGLTKASGACKLC